MLFALLTTCIYSIRFCFWGESKLCIKLTSQGLSLFWVFETIVKSFFEWFRFYTPKPKVKTDEFSLSHPWRVYLFLSPLFSRWALMDRNKVQSEVVLHIWEMFDARYNRTYKKSYFKIIIICKFLNLRCKKYNIELTL